MGIKSCITLRPAWCGAVLAGVLSVQLLSCSDSTPIEPPAPNPGIKVLQAPGPDTIEAVLAAPLTIEVRDTVGRPLAGAPVTFEGLIGRRDIGGPFGASDYVEMSVAPLGTSAQGYFFQVVRGTTDADGRLSVLLRLGPAAPQGRLAVEVGDPAAPMFRDTVTMTILPGAAAAVRMLSADTTFYPGRTLALSGVVVDRRENVRAGDTVRFETAPPLQVSSDGVVEATGYGVSYVVASGAPGRDSAQVAAVPQGGCWL